jgi:hypothetical protein
LGGDLGRLNPVGPVEAKGTKKKKKKIIKKIKIKIKIKISTLQKIFFGLFLNFCSRTLMK